jgi:putative RecB family exonuclease
MQGALSELHISHPTLPFVGIIDLVLLAGDGVTVVDFKTGEPKSLHRQQLMWYAVLWWRRTGQAPVAIEMRYLSHAATFSVSVDDLRSAEENLHARIDELTGLLEEPPATPRPGDQCRYCDVRQFCDAAMHTGRTG